VYAIAINNLEISRFLLENGADANRGGRSGNGLLYDALEDNKKEVARLLLQYGADPNLIRRPVLQEDDDWPALRGYRCTDWAIENGDSETLSMVLEHGGFVGCAGETADDPTSLNILLNDNDKSRETKVAISQMLVAHGKKDRDTLFFWQSSLEYAIEESHNGDVDDDDENEDDDDDHDDHGYDDDGNIHILLEAGVVPHSQAFYIAIREENLSLCQLLVHHGGNPFLPRAEDKDENDDVAASPFLAASRHQDILMFAYFLDLWYDSSRCSTSRSKCANNGDYPLHVICRDPHVSLQVIVLMAAHNAEAMSTLSSQEGLFPFQIASAANADLDNIFYLLHRCPDALLQFRLHAVTDPVLTGNTSSELGKKKNVISEGRDGMAIISLEDYNALQDENKSLRVEKDAAQAENDAAVKSLQDEIEKLQQALAAAAAAERP
jgi:hypothetical protein